MYNGSKYLQQQQQQNSKHFVRVFKCHREKKISNVKLNQTK